MKIGNKIKNECSKSKMQRKQKPELLAIKRESGSTYNTQYIHDLSCAKYMENN